MLIVSAIPFTGYTMQHHIDAILLIILIRLVMIDDQTGTGTMRPNIKNRVPAFRVWYLNIFHCARLA